MKLLVTGASGFVGRNLTQRLLDLGHEVRILTRSGSALLPTNKNLEIFKGDVTDLASLKLACQNIDSVFHLAGVVGYSKSMLPKMYETNVLGTKNIIEAFKENNCRRFVHMSSVVTIGASFNNKHILNEESKFNLQHLKLGYFDTKRSAENIVLSAVQNGLDAVILNPSTIYGAGDATKGSRSTQIKVARGKFPFYSSGGVSVVHIDDVVEATITAWHKGRTGQRYILAGENITIKDLFYKISQIAKVPPPKIYLPNIVILFLGMIGDILEKLNLKGPLNSENANTSILFHWYDHTKAKRELGFNPRPAIDAIRESVLWMKNNNTI